MFISMKFTHTSEICLILNSIVNELLLSTFKYLQNEYLMFLGVFISVGKRTRFYCVMLLIEKVAKRKKISIHLTFYPPDLPGNG